MRPASSYPSYEERVKQNNLIDFRGPDVNCKYTSSVTGCTFWGLNHDIEDSPSFSATRIDEMNALTIRVNNVAIIPRDVFIELQKFIESGFFGSSKNLRKTYEKYKSLSRED